MISTNNLKYYNNYQEIYKRPRGYFTNIATSVLDATNFSPSTKIKIIDIGCGYGDFLTALKKQFKGKVSLVGLTPSKEEFDYLKNQLKSVKAVKGQQQQLKKLKLGQNFDLVINFHTLSYIKQTEQLKMPSKLASLCKKNGYLVLAMMPDWIQFNPGVSQTGPGFVQFYYSPLLFEHLSKKFAYISQLYQDNENGYFITLWQKTPNTTFTRLKVKLIMLYFVVRNQVLMFPQIKTLYKAVRYQIKLLLR